MDDTGVSTQPAHLPTFGGGSKKRNPPNNDPPVYDAENESSVGIHGCS